jgi:hypothetical protein
VFDETVFPFANLHPNVGSLLRREILLLPEFLQNPVSSHEGNKHCTDLTPNAANIPGLVSPCVQETGEENCMQNGAKTSSNEASIRTSMAGAEHVED